MAETERIVLDHLEWKSRKQGRNNGGVTGPPQQASKIQIYRRDTNCK